MNIHHVRRKFQKPWNFTVLTNYNIDLSTAVYSLQQESLNSIDMLLYVTSEVNPELVGSLLEANGQKWIVAISMMEVNNEELYQYKLYPVTDTLELTVMIKNMNDLGAVSLVPGELLLLNCFVDDYSFKERTVQVVESYQQSFLIAANELLDYKGVYTLKYKGINFKIDSFERTVGLIKIRATENL